MIWIAPISNVFLDPDIDVRVIELRLRLFFIQNRIKDNGQCDGTLSPWLLADRCRDDAFVHVFDGRRDLVNRDHMVIRACRHLVECLAAAADAACRTASQPPQLILSGHTHGGQMPGVRQLVARANGGYVRGWYDVGGMKLYNSPGTSQWDGFIIRLFDPSEVTLFTLHAE